MPYSDEPNIVTPARRWSPKVIVITVLVLAAVGGILSIPFYQKNLDAEAHHARRGPHGGALYDISVDGAAHTIELGWIAPAFSAVLAPAPAEGVTLEVSGDFGRETLTWDVAQNRFGPGSLKLNPYGHYKVKLVLRQSDRVLWKDTLWLYGIHDTHGHSH